jgi:hypothetical protein
MPRMRQEDPCRLVDWVWLGLAGCWLWFGLAGCWYALGLGGCWYALGLAGCWYALGLGGSEILIVCEIDDWEKNPPSAKALGG